jgi:hypothetical protein
MGGLKVARPGHEGVTPRSVKRSGVRACVGAGYFSCRCGCADVVSSVFFEKRIKMPTRGSVVQAKFVGLVGRGSGCVTDNHIVFQTTSQAQIS